MTNNTAGFTQTPLDALGQHVVKMNELFSAIMTVQSSVKLDLEPKQRLELIERIISMQGSALSLIVPVLSELTYKQALMQEQIDVVGEATFPHVTEVTYEDEDEPDIGELRSDREQRENATA